MLKNELRFTTQVSIKAPKSDVWDALINPEKIKKYFFGTEATSDWLEGSELTFRGEWEGTTYVDKATIIKIIPERILQYNYISSFSALEDKPENRSVISMDLLDTSGGTTLSLTQQGFEPSDAVEHSTSNWKSVLEDLAKRVESGDW